LRTPSERLGTPGVLRAFGRRQKPQARAFAQDQSATLNRLATVRPVRRARGSTYRAGSLRGASCGRCPRLPRHDGRGFFWPDRRISLSFKRRAAGPCVCLLSSPGAWTRVARSVITACLAWSFSTALSQAEALASTARSLRARASFSTVGLQSVAFCPSGIACVLWSFSAAFGCELEVAGGTVRRLLAGV
jgi:hypothetical protein